MLHFKQTKKGKNPQCENLSNLLPLTFFVKSPILVNMEPQKLLNCHFCNCKIKVTEKFLKFHNVEEVVLNFSSSTTQEPNQVKWQKLFKGNLLHFPQLSCRSGYEKCNWFDFCVKKSKNDIIGMSMRMHIAYAKYGTKKKNRKKKEIKKY